MWRQNGYEPFEASSAPEDGRDQDEPVSTHFNTNNFGNFLEVDQDKLTVQYTGAGAHNNDVGAIQGNRPVPRRRQAYYFEALIVEAGDQGKVCIGFSDKAFKMGKQPGWEANSYGYYGADGKKLHASPEAGEAYGPSFRAGDVVGAGLHIQRQEIFFTKNGKYLGVAFRGVAAVPLYPTVGLHSRGACISANFGAQPFRFALDDMLAEERAQQEAAVQQIPIPAGVTHRLVRGYLMHFGYAHTLSVFDSAAGSTPDSAEVAGCSGRGVEEKAALATLACRQAVRAHLMAGRVDAASALLKQHAPTLVEAVGADARPDLDVYFSLNCLKFIELIRAGQIEEAVAFAQASLAPLRGLLSHRNRAYDAMLHDVIALLAYEQPLESSLAWLMHPSQREATADVVNSALLAAAVAKCSGQASASSRQPKPQAALERLLQQLVGVQDEWLEANGGLVLSCACVPVQAALERLLQQLVGVQDEWLEANGGLGEPFRLQRHLLPPAALLPKKAPASPHRGGAHHNGAAPMERD